MRLAICSSTTFRKNINYQKSRQSTIANPSPYRASVQDSKALVTCRDSKIFIRTALPIDGRFEKSDRSVQGVNPWAGGPALLRISSGRLLAYFVLLVIPSLIAFSLPLYNMVNPTLDGLPFFYWFQTILLGVTVIPYLVFSWAENRRMSKQEVKT
jgi:hypothetical protein